MSKFHISYGRRGTALTTLAKGKHFRFDIDAIEKYFSKRMPPLIVDMLRIAMGVYVADRLVRRKTRDHQKHWSRSLNVKIGVNEPDFWNTTEIRDSLTECLEFVSDDDWNVSFVLEKRISPDLQRRLFQTDPLSRVCPFSGGLDSAAGLANQLCQEPSRPAIPVTIWHQGGQRHIVRRQLKNLQQTIEGIDIDPLVIKAHLLKRAKLNRHEEPTQRSRAFLFMAASAAAALMGESSEVEVYESGIGAVNLPLMSGMVGSRTTRSSHPEFLRMMSKFVSVVASKNVKFVLPFLNLTKGQVVKQLAENGLGTLAKQTVSCVHFPLRVKTGKQCGICPACIFRRQAMLTAGIEENAATYKCDLFTAQNDLKPKESDLIYLKAYMMQVEELRSIGLPKFQIVSRGICLEPES